MIAKSLLVIEDDVESLSALSELLLHAGYRVITASTGRDGLKVLHGVEPLDLVLLDFWLPDMTGHAFLATRTRWPGALSLPVLLITGDDAYIDEHQDLRQLGVVGVLRKPLEPERVLSAVEQATASQAASVENLVAFEPRSPEPPTSSTPSVGRQARRLADLLVRASELLAQTVDVTTDLRDVTKLVVPSVADFCVIEQAERGVQQRRLLCSVHADATQDGELRQLAERGEGLLRAAGDVLESGHPVLYEHVTDDVLSALAHTATDAQALRRLGFDSVIILPMVARRRVFGTMIWASFGTHRCYGRAHLGAAADLAHRIALALDNDQLTRTAQHAIRAREELLALVSHDLRTPLSTISAAAAKSLQTAGSQADADCALTILRNARRMERMIRDMLDFSQLEAGSLRVELRRERLPDLLRDAVEASRALAGKHALVLEVDAAARDLDVLCDRERILQVVANLTSNAVRTMPAQGRVTVRLSRAEGEACIAVSDTGNGVSAEDLPTLFDGLRNLRKVGSQGGEHADDAGLGLYIARGLVEAHGGRLWLQNGSQRGSTFCFTLRSRETAEAGAANPSSGPILLVDDDVAFRRELQEILRERGYNVETADNGWQAWSYLQVNPPPALILLDLMMPVMDGWELHAAIKSHPILAAVPIVIVSCLDRHRIEPSLADAQGYIEKPIRTAQLFEVVQQHVSCPAPLRGHSLRTAS
jgi:signal transduction histidine kinase/CheY-like chemotaxis protein